MKLIKPTPLQCKEEALNYLPKRFGIPKDVLEAFNFLWSGGAIWMTSLPLEILPRHRAVQRVGIRALRRTIKGWKPTTPLLQFFSSHITLNRIVLTKEQLKLLLINPALDCFREGISVDELTEGYVALALGDLLIGCGYFTGRFLTQNLSKPRASELAEALGLKVPHNTIN